MRRYVAGGSDVAVVGFGSSGDAASAYARDAFLRDYLPCTIDNSTLPPTLAGTCADTVWAGEGWKDAGAAGGDAASLRAVENVELTGARVAGGGDNRPR